MSAEDAFRAGKLDDAVAEQGAVVRAAPLDADARWKLFVLLCFAGELERAEKQLDALATRDDGLARSAVVHRALLASGGNKTAAAKALGISRAGLLLKLKRLGMT